MFGDCSLVGDARWAGTYGVVGDYIARDNCRSPPVNLRSRGASIVIQDMQMGLCGIGCAIRRYRDYVARDNCERAA